MSEPALPYPPFELIRRVFDMGETEDPVAEYERIGRATRDQIVELLPGGFSLEGGRALDFGCGAGRVLRQFAPEARGAEIWGCDIDRPSVEWVRENLCPPFEAALTGEAAPLPFPDGHFDLVWAVSVFSHLTDLWAEWLLEVHRVLAEGGILIASLVDRGDAETSWGEELVGMNRLKHANPWDAGGPVVLHSEWWLRAHWGRAFEVERVHRAELPGTRGKWVVLRRRPIKVTAEELRAPEPGMEGRELRATQHNLTQLEWELEQALADQGAIAERYESSRSWRMTRPLRAIAGRLRRDSS